MDCSSGPVLSGLMVEAIEGTVYYWHNGEYKYVRVRVDIGVGLCVL